MEQEEAEKYIFNEALSSHDREYVMELTTYGLQRLEKEPEYLSSEKKRLDKELEDMTVENLSIFLQTSSTVNESQNLVHSMQSHVDNIIVTIPSLMSKSTEFANKTRQLRNKRKANRKMVAHQMKVLEILELPQLMWKCARSKLYREALDLQSYAIDLFKRNRDILILSALIKQMDKTQKYILNELLLSLEKSLQLPECLKIIGYLTRMNVFDNDELLLRTEFLARRLKYLHSLIPKYDEQQRHNMMSTDAYDYLSKFIDLYRMHIFSIVTQYKAIFVDDTFMNNTSRSFTEDLLVVWVHKRVIDIVSTIEALLPLVQSGSFIHSLGQSCDYCGQSLAMVGMDFRGLLPPIFEKRIRDLFETNCNAAILQFQSALTNHDWFVTVELLSTMGVIEKQSDELDEEIVVPQILLQYPPLAVLTNGFIKAFNELREFVTYSVMQQSKMILINAIQATVNSIRKFSVSSHHYHTPNRRTSSLRRRSSSKKYTKRKTKMEKEEKESDVKDGNKENEDDGEEEEELVMDEVEDEMDEVLANLVKVQCEYLLPFLCDIFDLLFERRKEIEIDDLLEYFTGLYIVPQFTTVSDDDIGDNDDKKEEKDGEQTETDIASKENVTSDVSELGENTTSVNNDVDEISA